MENDRPFRLSRRFSHGADCAVADREEEEVERTVIATAEGEEEVEGGSHEL